MMDNHHKSLQILLWTSIFITYGSDFLVTASTVNDNTVAAVGDPSSKYFYNKKRDPREIGVYNNSDTYYVLVDDLFDPSFQIFDGTRGKITIPSHTPISLYCGVCVKRKALSNTSHWDHMIEVTLTQKMGTYSNWLEISTDEHKCIISSFSMPSGLDDIIGSQWLTCDIHTPSSNIYRYMHMYIDVVNRNNTHFIYNDLFRVPKSTKYLACRRPNNESEIYDRDYIFFWGKLVENQSTLCPKNTMNSIDDDDDDNNDEFPKEVASRQFANRTKYKIIPILENGMYLPVINQVQVTNINDNIFSDKIICIRYGYLTSSKKKQSVRVIVWYLDKNAPNIVSIPIEVNTPCVYPLMRYSGKYPSLLIHTQEQIDETTTLNNNLTILGYCIVVSVCIIIVITCVIVNRNTLFLYTSGRSNRRYSSYKQDFGKVLNTGNL
uniref:Uncharacterized protein n=1 Tax=Penaeus monodon majanivirus B TaxID=2984272 RepID=A0A9C7F6C2_9VIRU|nr:MAG: hypothetical protein [Penaeus monodon majanivirus B]